MVLAVGTTDIPVFLYYYMNFSAPFIRRPVATILLAIGLLIAGTVAYRFLPLAALPNVDIPTIVVFAGRPGGDPETMATSIAAPLERRIGKIPGLNEMTSIILSGSVAIVAQFDVSRDFDGAARDVQAALNAAATDLPAGLPNRPYYRKLNPADTPILTIALTSDTLPLGKIFDAADSILRQRLSQVDGVGQVAVDGADLPAVRIRLNPAALAAAGLSANDVNNAVRAANVLGPTGGTEAARRAATIDLDSQIKQAAGYRSLVLKRSGDALVTLADVASVIDATANRRLSAWADEKPAILLEISKSANANVIDSVDNIKQVLPLLRSWMPPDIDLTILSDRTISVRAGVHDAEITLLISIALVLLVVALFMRRVIPTIAAGIAIPLAIAGTLVVMWFEGFAIDNFSLMALTISVGFVVDDAIVMIENIVRHVEQGERPMTATLLGARQIGFTVVSISLSLVAVFIPLLFMGGILGRLFHEFATTLTAAILVSAAVSLTVTPMLCAHFMSDRRIAAKPPKPEPEPEPTGIFAAIQRRYDASLTWALRHRGTMVALTIIVTLLTVALYITAPKSLLPEQDNGLLEGITIADTSVSFQAMAARQRAVVETLLRDPAVDHVGSQIGSTIGFNSLNRGTVTVSLKPRDQRPSSAAVLARLRPALAGIGGVQTFLDIAQDLRAGARQGAANQIVLLGGDLGELRDWTFRLEQQLRTIDGIADVSSDQDLASPQVQIVIDRDAAARLGVSVADIDAALTNAFTQRPSSIIYADRNQYRVVLETDPALQADASQLDRVFVGGPKGKQVQLGSVAHFVRGSGPLVIRHQGSFTAATIGFNLKPGLSLGTAMERLQAAAIELHMPANLHLQFAGNAKFLVESLRTQPLLIAAALLSIYIVLGVLYESLTQPLTIVASLPAAGLGALLALRLTHTDLSIPAIIGILLLMGIVKKNAIMLIDFALEQERRHGRSPAEAIHAACLARVRPIMMTTLAALLGALPLALAFGTGAELRQPLGIAIAGGLVVSQLLTLYTTPAIYLALQPRRRARASLDLLSALTQDREKLHAD